ncbi:MAG: APC family permease [Chitinophagaceae bacterium]
MSNLEPPPQLTRKISLLQATAINMIDMVGIGPFVVMPLVMKMMGGNTFFWAWILGAVIAFADGMVWAELGAAFPAAGGSYQFLKSAYSGNKWGRLLPFLFVWQTLFQAPLVVASGAIGFSQYFSYWIPLGHLEGKMLSGGVVLLLTLLLYRKIDSIGKISVFLWVGVLVTILWIIVGGFSHAPIPPIFHAGKKDPGFSLLSALLWVTLGHATVKTMYSYLGYYNVCHLGSEIKKPARNIPLSIFISILGIASLYLAMNLSMVRVLPMKLAQSSPYLVSIFMEVRYGKTAAAIATGLILWVAFASIFSAMLGYSRIPYAAAVEGDFFPIFSRLHPKKNFPYVSLLALGGTAFVFSLLFRLTDVISAILAMRILVQFIGQAIGLLVLHKKSDPGRFPFKMIGYPFPVFFTIAAWVYIFFSTGRIFALWGIGMALMGTLVFIGLYFRRNFRGNKIHEKNLF